MQILLSVLCESAAPDPMGRLNVTGVFNELYAPGFPAKQEQMVLVLAIEWEHEDHGRFQFRADLVSPSGKPCLTVNGHTDVDRRPPERPPPQTRLVMPLEDVVFPEAGRYQVRIRVKGHELQGPPLHLVEASAPEGAPA